MSSPKIIRATTGQVLLAALFLFVTTSGLTLRIVGGDHAKLPEDAPTILRMVNDCLNVAGVAGRH